jgi:hypothetical protein
VALVPAGVSTAMVLRAEDYRTNCEHRVLNIARKANKERATQLHLEAVEKLAAWLDLPAIGDVPAALSSGRSDQPATRAKIASAKNRSRSGAVEKLIDRYVTALGPEANVTHQQDEQLSSVRHPKTEL